LRELVDWDEREAELVSLLDKLSQSSQSDWDCVVPVSGGKDSTYQVIKMRELGLRVLCVSSRPCHLTPIGRRNLENLRQLDVDLIEVAPDADIRRRMNRIGLELVGDISWPEHVGIFTIPVKLACEFHIPLIVWGENSQNEYGGPSEAASNPHLDRRWLEEYGGLLGLRVSDIPRLLSVSEDRLGIYQYPSDEALQRASVTGIFLGHYFPWDGLTNAVIASAYGFEVWPTAVEGSMACYENLDNFQTGIHDYFKYLKFGFGRTTDIASTHVRRGRISREMALEIVRLRDGRYPAEYLGLPLVEVLKPLGMSQHEFDQIADSHTNVELFEVDESGALRRRRDGSPRLRME